MAEKPTRHEPVEHDERARQAELALLVAALGGGPGDRTEADVRGRGASGRAGPADPSQGESG